MLDDLTMKLRSDLFLDVLRASPKQSASGEVDLYEIGRQILLTRDEVAELAETLSDQGLVELAGLRWARLRRESQPSATAAGSVFNITMTNSQLQLNTGGSNSLNVDQRLGPYLDEIRRLLPAAVPDASARREAEKLLERGKARPAKSVLDALRAVLEQAGGNLVAEGILRNWPLLTRALELLST